MSAGSAHRSRRVAVRCWLLMEYSLFTLVDLLGTFAFAISGVAAAKERRLDWFGVFAVAYLTACGGGIVRDLCLGAVPPLGISESRYLACTAFASIMTIGAGSWLERFKHPVTWFDSVGLGFFAVAGAHRSLQQGAGISAAIVLGTVTAIGGGMMRDVLLNRVPAILEKEIYALAALVAAVIQVVAEVKQVPIGLTQCIAIAACLAIRFLALRYSWALPVVGGR
jgi:uncharacterized membrane protein YeiH